MNMKTNLTAVSVGLATALTLGICSSNVYAHSSKYEVWAIDQAHTHDEDGDVGVEDGFGGTVYIYSGSDSSFKKGHASVEHFNLKDATIAAGLEIGSKPHMTLWANSGSHLVIGHASNGVVIAVDGDSRMPVDSVSPGTNAHAAIPADDGTFILVADIGGQSVHRVETNWDAGAGNIFGTITSLDLGAAGVAAAVGAGSAKPICPIVTDDSAYSYVTLAAGGLAIIDNAAMSVMYTYTVDEALDLVDANSNGVIEAGGDIGQNGCGGIQMGNTVYINSGTKNPQNAEMIYAFDNSVLPYSKPSFVKIPQGGNDSHGMMAAGDYLWGCNRGSNTCNVMDTTDGNRIVNTVDLQGHILGDTAPDLIDSSPSGKLMFIAQRGPQPVSANSGTYNNAVGDKPGVGVVEIKKHGKNGKVKTHYRITNLDENGLERADIHSLRVRK